MQIKIRKPCVQKKLSPDIPVLLDSLFRSRGIDNISKVDFSTKALLHYNLMLNTSAAAKLIAEHMDKGQRIIVIGDFDADGATSTALCVTAIRMCGYENIDFLVPNRFDFGYGLSPQIVDVAHERGASLIITVDNGIACIDGANRARDLGLDLIVTDHHLPGESEPNANVIVNPNQRGCAFPSKNIAGVGVIFYVMLALKQTLVSLDWFDKRSVHPPNFATLLDLVAVGTVADVVPLDQNNRILVHQGLQRIRSNRARVGISAIVEVANRKCENLTSTDLGFLIGPRLNAAGRLDDMSLGIDTLLASDTQTARQLAFELDRLNQSRKAIESDMQAQAEKAMSELCIHDSTVPSAIVVYQQNFHQGVIGIVAGRLKELHNRPSFVFAKDGEGEIKGSARSIKGIHIRDVLDELDKTLPNCITKFGGHAMAAGLTIKETKLTEFSDCIDRIVSEKMRMLPDETFLLSDGVLDESDLTVDTAKLLNMSVPWGQYFEEPLFEGEFSIVSQKLVAKKHLKLMLKYQTTLIDAIAFNVDLTTWPNPEILTVKIAYRLKVNNFRERQSLQFVIEYIEPV